MRRLVLVLTLLVTPLLFAQVDKTGGTAAHGAEATTHEKVHPEEGPAKGAEHLNPFEIAFSKLKNKGSAQEVASDLQRMSFRAVVEVAQK